MGVVNIPGQNLTWQMRSRPNGLYSVQNKGKPMQLRRKMKKKAQMMMVPDTATATNIAKPALLPQPANYMRVSTALFATIGFPLLALAGKVMAMLPIDTWNPKCIQTLKFLWIRFRKKTPIHGTASDAGKKSLQTKHLYRGSIVLPSNRRFVLGLKSIVQFCLET
jgi:hypothetical protein